MGDPEGNVSYWVESAPQTSFPAYQGDDLRVEVAVLGGGITGLATAMLLTQTGVSVAVIEAGRVACGVTGYTTAKLRRTFGSQGARIYGEANQAGLELIGRLVEELAIDCDFERLPAFTYTEDHQRVSAIEEEVEAAQQAGLPASFSSAIGLPFTVKTEHGSLRVNHVVLATHLPFFDPTGLFAKTSPSRSYALAVSLAEPAPPGMYLSADPATRSVRPLVSGGNQAVLAGEEHKVGHGRDTHAHYEALEGWARERFPVRSV